MEADELDRALGLLVEAERREAALSGLQAALDSDKVDVLSAALQEAEEAGLAAGELEAARAALALLAQKAGVTVEEPGHADVPEDAAARRDSSTAISGLEDDVLAATCYHDAAGVKKAIDDLDAAGVKSAQVCDLTNSDGNSLLHFAVRELPPDESWSAALDTVQVLLELQCDINSRNTYDETPLMLAMRAASACLFNPASPSSDGHGVQIVEALLRAGADPNAGDDQGETPLMEAACVGNLELCRALLAGRADPCQTSSFGLTAVDVSSPEVASLLNKAKASSPDVPCN